MVGTFRYSTTSIMMDTNAVIIAACLGDLHTQLYLPNGQKRVRPSTRAGPAMVTP